MKYMMFVVVDPDAEADPARGRHHHRGVAGRRREPAAPGSPATRLRPTSDATTVRISKGEVLVTDGPFTESKEWIAGFDILECEDLDEAIAIAARHPQANGGKHRAATVLAAGRMTDDPVRARR